MPTLFQEGFCMNFWLGKHLIIAARFILEQQRPNCARWNGLTSFLKWLCLILILVTEDSNHQAFWQVSWKTHPETTCPLLASKVKRKKKKTKHLACSMLFCRKENRQTTHKPKASTCRKMLFPYVLALFPFPLFGNCIGIFVPREKNQFHSYRLEKKSTQIQRAV